MKLKEHMAAIAALVAKHPEALELDIVTSSDDEGNSFNGVHYHPTIGIHEGPYEGFTTVEGDISTANAVCLN